ncbi:hypothetical protein SAMN05216345_111147 [Cupriavidus sp. YR651]|uniref:hypothetical protein n=1 Tax=Cupriavidus sp. YR651 TaxID=1855315 RepID=UPI0008900224|nr:hypothetical protein [Cupriavidus sp. YR651]SDD58511.1 hypothetical protein SAMN05216345_111147 [Cupriavidus sp. YR651]
MNAKKLFFINLYLAFGFCGAALASRAFRYFEYKGWFAAPWLAIPRDWMACIEHVLTGIGFPALLVAISWLSWGLVRSRTRAVESRAMQLIDSYGAAILMFAQVTVYLVYAAYWEFAPHGAVGPVTGKLANQFIFDVLGVAQYIAIMTKLRAFASTRELGREISLSGFRFFRADAGPSGVTVADLERFHSRYPKLGLYITMHDDGGGETRPRLVFICDGMEVYNPLCGSPTWVQVDPAAEYGIARTDALAIARVNGC